MEEPKIKLLGLLFKHTVDFFHSKDFVQLMPVMLGRAVDTLDGDAGSQVEKIPEIEYCGAKWKLVTSMILHKQIAIQKFEKIFVMSPNIRLEKPEKVATGRHLFEFTQADFEIRYAKMHDIMKLIEEYYQSLSKFLRGHKEIFEKLGVDIFEFKPPFKVYTTHELKEEFGEDWEFEASKQHKQPFWVICHKREFYDREDPKREGHYLNYDLIYPFGFGEGISGAEREYEYERILKKLKEKDLLEKCSAYLEFIRKRGLLPSAGAGIGMERLAKFLTRAEHIKEVSLFKRVPGIIESI